MKTNSSTALNFSFPPLLPDCLCRLPILYSVDLSFYDWNGVSAVRNLPVLGNWTSLLSMKFLARASQQYRHRGALDCHSMPIAMGLAV
jgi:hypothetical protein